MKGNFFSIGVTILLVLLFLSACASSPTAKLTTTVHPEAPSPNQNRSERAKSPLPPPVGLVNDYGNVFDPQFKQKLESVLMELKNKSDIEFAVVTIETTGGEPIFDYSLTVAKAWALGPKDTSKGGGLLLMLAVKDRQWRIQVSRSLEKDLPDEVCKELGDQSLDLYRRGEYAEGITKFVKAIIARLEKIRGFEVSRISNLPSPR
ncbi:MAG TPA: TPM domain-containing protein [Pyrinomonadaceae bacterium]|nr:TPM domain-containing protein [Pyrinomonadaceae bacterium]